jgi:hypothetical protein
MLIINICGLATLQETLVCLSDEKQYELLLTLNAKKTGRIMKPKFSLTNLCFRLELDN